ncbi:hypothetical protein ACET3X_005240 [Alternaria dauci]|uniref:C3H1-type domain-containing protein n=1 Tax=Alternaria dauci TaxID=48095 RepID=A0ABR3UL31_9PLEO
MAGKKRNHSDNATSQSDKRIKIKNEPTIREEEDVAFAPQPAIPETAEAIVPIETKAKTKKAIVPVANTTIPKITVTKENHEDEIDWSEDESEITESVNAANKTSESVTASEDDIETTIADETDITLIGSEEDIGQIKMETTDVEEKSHDIKLTDEIAKPVSKSTQGSGDRKKKKAETHDSVTRAKVVEDTSKEKQEKAKEAEAVERRKSNEAYSAEGRNIIFKGIETSLQFADLAAWVGVGVVGSTETRQITVDGVTIEVTVKLLNANFEQKTHRNVEAGDTVPPTTETPPQLAVDTAVASKSGDTSATRPATPAAPSAIVGRGKLIACRFGNECKKQATCMFDHSQHPTKKMCSFVNTTMGCNKGSRCIYSHEHEGQMCPFDTVRMECPNTFKCSFLHMDDEPPTKAEEISKSQVSSQPVVCAPSAADIAERAAINRASREAAAASAPPPHAPTGPKSNKRSRGAESADPSIQPQRVRYNYQTPTYFNQQQLQGQQWQAMPGFAPPTIQFVSPLGGYNAPQGQYTPAQVPYHPQQSFPNFGGATNQQHNRGHGHGRGRGSSRMQGGGRGWVRGKTDQNDRQHNSSSFVGQDRGTKVGGAADSATAGASNSRTDVQGSGKKA